MENAKVRKTDVLAVLKTNRDKHKAIFEEALVGYRETAIRLLTERLDQLRGGKHISATINLSEPMNQTRDYDRAITMLEMSIEDVVELSEQDFQYYVLDDWSWKRQFLSSNRAYSMTAASALGE